LLVQAVDLSHEAVDVRRELAGGGRAVVGRHATLRRVQRCYLAGLKVDGESGRRGLIGQMAELLRVVLKLAAVFLQ